MAVTYVLVVRLPSAGVESFQRYEAAVLPLLAEYDGRLERRLQSSDQRTEVHVLSFPTAVRFEAYRSDPRRASHAHLLAAAQAQVELYEMSDVG
ncbi:MAG: hypothetical protein JO046_25695 [Solirubrobacterales bacterium]|nr:hypothetical protein [Solirubrobacterales bacterium]